MGNGTVAHLARIRTAVIGTGAAPAVPVATVAPFAGALSVPVLDPACTVRTVHGIPGAEALEAGSGGAVVAIHTLRRGQPLYLDLFRTDVSSHYVSPHFHVSELQQGRFP